MPIILMTTVNKNRPPEMMATLRSLFLSNCRFVCPYDEGTSSAIIRNTIAKTANNTLNSESVKGGNCVPYSPNVCASSNCNSNGLVA